MQKRIYLTISLFLFTFLAFAQNIELDRATVEHNEEQRPCVRVTLKAPEPKPVKKAWEDFMDNEYDVSMKGIGFLSNKDVLTAEKVQIPALSEKAVNFYTRIVEQGDQTEMCIFSSFGYDIYISPDEYPEAYETMETMTANFLKSYLPEYYNEQIEVSQENVDDIQDEINDLKETLAENEEEINKLQEENAEIEKNLVDQEEKLRKAEQILNEHQTDLNQVKKDLSAIEL